MLKIIDCNHEPTTEELREATKFLERLKADLESKGGRLGGTPLLYHPTPLVELCKPFWKGDGWKPDLGLSDALIGEAQKALDREPVPEAEGEANALAFILDTRLGGE